MNIKSVNLLEIPVSIESRVKLLEIIRSYLTAKSPQNKTLIISSINPENIVLAQENSAYRSFLQQSHINIPDGVGVLWAVKWVHGPSFMVHRENSLRTTNYELRTLERIPGVELMEDLVSFCAEKAVTAAFIGGKLGVANRALECLQKWYVGLSGWTNEPADLRITDGKLHLGNHEEDGYFQQLAKKIQSTQTRMIFVGLGAPKQEFFIQYLQKELATINYEFSVVMMSVGGAFDIISGKTPRAPHLLRNLGLEWLWRLILEPWRLQRQFRLIVFVWKVLRK